MSRIIVKNLPKRLTEEELKEKFSEKGCLTDVQLKYTKDGKFRQFAFVGYSTEEEAKAAISYFNKSFFKSSRIVVEQCAQIGDESKPRAWSKHAPDSSAFKKLHAPETPTKEDITSKVKKPKAVNPVVQKLVEKIEKYKNDPAFIEYMEVHGKDTKTWTESDMSTFLSIKSKSDSKERCNEDSGVEEGGESEEDETKKIVDDSTVSDADYLKLKTGKITLAEVQTSSKASADEKYFTLKIRGLPYKAKKKAIKEFFRPLKVDSIRVPPKIKGMAYVGFKDMKNMRKALLRDKSFLDGKRIFISELKAAATESANEYHSGQVTNKWVKQEESLKNEEDVAESGRIFVRNLPYTCTEDELQLVFEKFGPITEIIIPLDKLTRKIKGYGVVTFLIPEHAVKAYAELDGTIFHGRMLHLLPGKAKEVHDDGVKEKSSFKTKKLKSLKSEADSSYNWNTLFMGHNAVANVIASTYNTSKEEVLSGSNAAVRLALGETQLVQETKEFLESSGVKLDAFNRAVNHRSKNVILVKNLPAETRVDEIREIFSKHGVLGRVILPPYGITSIVEFVEPAEARTAFRRLAYSRFKHVPLYLEWAPDDTFQGIEEKTEDNASETNTQKNEEPEDEMEPEPETTLFIKNLNFDTNEDAIRQHFKNCGRIASVTVARKKDPKKPGALLSMGYGFIQFYKQSSTNTALKTLQQSDLEGHCVELKRSNRTIKETSHISRKSNNVEKQTGSKILVRNIPFEAKLSELKELFKVFGDIKNIRLPKKMVGTGPHRGFAFVEYSSKEDAKNAMQSLCQSTHLYGRRLVLEWAQTDEANVTELRKRTAERFPKEKEVRNKKSKADIDVGKSDDDEEDDDDVNMFDE